MKNNNTRLRQLAAFAAVMGATVASSSAALTTSVLDTSIGSAVTVAEGLITTGFAVTALFILVKVIKKGAAKIG